MKVVLINGSPRKEECTFTALSEVAKALAANGVDSEIVHIGTKAMQGCIACSECKKSGRCVFRDDVYDKLFDMLDECSGMVIGSPVYFAGPNGSLCALLDRFFSTATPKLIGMPAAAVVSCRRGGASATFDRLNKYFTIKEMPVVSSQYWNSVHGFCADDVRKDLEGLQIMRTLGNHMAWMVKTFAESKVPRAKREERISTNFHATRL